MTNHRELEDLEMHLLLEAIFRHYGYDFRDYAPASLKRRIQKCMAKDDELKTISGLQERVLHDTDCMNRFLHAVTVEVTSLFRDPGFYKAFREKVVPSLSALEKINIWHAGCATGEEVYSMAILLREEGLLTRSRIYATDMANHGLRAGKEGIYPINLMKEYSRNYQEAGGKGTFSDYFRAKYDHALMDRSLAKDIVWAQHNLATDASFKEFNVILCRNVMIYFNRSLQSRVHSLFYESLEVGGVLGLGSKETITFSSHEQDYEVLAGTEKLYRKVK
jgi:chemotaxis protein methyltransferase CheR